MDRAGAFDDTRWMEANCPAPAPERPDQTDPTALVAGLEQRLAAANAQRDEAVKELEMFSHSISHDLRAPLRGIAGFARILSEDQDSRLDEEGRRALQTIRAEAARMDHLIDRLGGYTRLGRQRLDRGETNMADLARSAFQELTEPAGARAPVLEVGELPPAMADRAMIRVLFTQLLDNALKFTRGNPAARIAVTGVADGGWNTYCVADDGVGFDPRYAHKLFTLFQRLHRRDDFEGAGVGLALVHRIVQRHGGVTRAEGEVGRGARIYFTLPGSPKTNP